MNHQHSKTVELDRYRRIILAVAFAEIVAVSVGTTFLLWTSF
jgi:hypothetical protein